MLAFPFCLSGPLFGPCRKASFQWVILYCFLYGVQGQRFPLMSIFRKDSKLFLLVIGRDLLLVLVLVLALMLRSEFRGYPCVRVVSPVLFPLLVCLGRLVRCCFSFFYYVRNSKLERSFLECKRN